MNMFVQGGWVSLVDMIGSNNKRVERATLLYIINNCNILKGS